MSLDHSDSEKNVKVGSCWQLSDGRYLSSTDSELIERVLQDLQRFNKKCIRNSILIFPPFNNFHRFLIHKLVEEDFKDLTTFSIGQSSDRRTVVCYKDRVIQNGTTDEDRSTCVSVDTTMGIEQRTSECHEDNITSAYSGRKKARILPDVALYQPPAMRRASEGHSDRGAPLDKSSKPSKQRRPDIAVYVPRALRGLSVQQSRVAKDSCAERMSPCVQSGVSLSPQASPAATLAVGPHLSSSPPTSRLPLDDGCWRAKGGHHPPPAESGGGGEHWSSGPSSPGGGDTEGTIPALGREASEGGEEAPEGKEVRRRGVGVLGGTGDHWEDLLVDEEHGELGGELLDEVVAAVGKVSVVERPRSDYTQYRTDDATLSLAELTHVVEIFGFPAEFKTHDLVSILSPYGGGPGFEIKWVDDTHALAVFASAFIATDVLNLRHPMVRTRAMDGASAVSRAKARRIGESLRVPYRPRPETCAALAQRLITGALGVQHRQSKEEREEERRLLREAREKRRSAARERDAAWEGTISSTLL